MKNALFNLPPISNEPIKSYAPGTPEREELARKIEELKAIEVEYPCIIGGKEVKTDRLEEIRCPHDHQHLLGHYHQGGKQELEDAIKAALAAKPKWEAMSWEARAAIFLKAADLIAGPYRMKMNAATMLGQSKNIYQAEIDSACEACDFIRYNVRNMYQLYSQQPASSAGIWNQTVWRPLEGFVFALTPFNFTAIASNLPGAPALMGNVCVWKPSRTAAYSAGVIMEVFKEAGLPDGVINLVYCSGSDASNVIFSHKEFAGIHFTGSTEVFNTIWKSISDNISNYKSYPRIVGETGGKDYIFVAPSAKTKEVATAIVRGAFEYQGQKCSAASRAYIPQSLWEEIKGYVHNDLSTIKMGPVEDFTNFINAVIDEKSYDKLVSYIEQAKKDDNAEVIMGGNASKEKGYFIEPTVILAKTPDYITMKEELFGPVITIYVYEDDKMMECVDLVNQTSCYALTGAIFSQCREQIELLSDKLRHSAGNFYINDKPTGAVVDQQPFGGSRASGTNDKAGSILNLIRWVSPQTIKETFVPATHYSYPNFEQD